MRIGGVAPIDSYGATDVGRRRPFNEDCLAVDEEVGLFIVADGMGGHNAGEIASKLTVETVSGFIRRARQEEDMTWPYGVDPKLSLNANRLRTAIMLANKRVWKEADNREEYTGMGTTVVAAVVGEDNISFASAGDSRVYRIRGEKIEQMTTDDSWVQVAINEGVLEPEEAERHPMRNIITKAIGAKESIDFSINEEKLEEGDVYLLCSDGLHGMLSDDEILEIVVGANGQHEKCVRDLIQASNDKGGKDNVTAVVLGLRK